MSTFNDFIKFFEAMGRPLQSDSCGHGAQRDAATGNSYRLSETPAGAQEAPESEVVSGASGEQEPLDRETMRKDWEWSVYRRCAQEEESDGRLDAMAGRAQAANRVLAKQGICPEKDCLRANPKIECRLYHCAECCFISCALCMEMHEDAGHWTDAMTAREMERSR